MKPWGGFSGTRWWSMVLKEFTQLKRDRLTFAMIVGIPIMQTALFGYAINTNPKHLDTAIISADDTDITRSFITALENSSYFTVVATLPNEAAGREAFFGESEIQASRDRVGLLADIIAVEAEAGFQTQRVARAQPGGDCAAGDQGFRQCLARSTGTADLEPVLTRITRAGDDAGDTRYVQRRRIHEFKAGGFGYHIDRLWPLHCQQGAIELCDHRQALGAHMRDVHIFAAGIQHRLQVCAQIGHHQVIDDPACLIKQQCITLPPRLQPGYIARHQALERGCIGDFDLPHVRHIEQRRTGAAGQMLGHDALILQGHFVPGKFDHARAQTPVQRVQRCFLQNDPLQISRQLEAPAILTPLCP